MDNFQQFLDLMAKLSSDKPDLISASEKVLKQISDQNPEFLLLSLVNVLKLKNLDVKIRWMAALLIRQRSTTINNFMKKISPEAQESIKRDLLIILQEETDKDLLRAYSDMLSILSSTVLITGKWSELFDFLTAHWLKSPNELQRDAAMRIFSGVMQNALHLKSYHNFIADIFAAGLSDPSFNIRVIALEGAIHLLVHNDSFIKRFQQFLPNIVQMVTSTIKTNEDIAVRVLSLLHDIAEVVPEYLEKDIDNFLLFVTQLYAEKSLEDEHTRYLAGSLFATVCESIPHVIRKKKQILHQFIPIALDMMADIEDDPDWHLTDSKEQEDDISKFGHETIDRLAQSIKGNVFCPIIFSFLPTLLTSASWKSRHAGILSISAIGEGCKKFLIKHLDKVLNFILPLANDQHERVRWACSTAIGVMSADFTPILQAEFSHIIFPVLDNALDDPVARNRSQAAGVLVNFCPDCDGVLLEPFAHSILTKIARNITERQDFLFLQHPIIAMSSIASTLGDSFLPYYEAYTTLLFSILQRAKGLEKQRELSGITVESLCLMGSSVGKENFAFISQALVNELVQMQQEIKEASDPRIISLQSAWKTIVQVLENEFAPYFNYLVEDLYKRVAFNPNVEIFNVSELNEINEDEWNFMNIDSSNVAGINTSALEEKAHACGDLTVYISAMNESFFPFIPKFVPLCEGLIKYEHSGEIRKYGAAIMSGILQSCSSYLSNRNESKLPVYELFNHFFPLLYTTIMDEVDPDVSSSISLSLYEILSSAGKEAIDQNYAQKITALINSMIKLFLEKEGELLSELEKEDFDPEDRETLEEQLTFYYEIFIYATDLLGKMIEFVGEQYLPVVQSVIPHYTRYLNGEEEKSRHAALCLFDDILEFGGPNGAKLVEKWMPHILQAAGEVEVADICQTAVYGIGLCAEYAPGLFLPYVSQCIGGLSHIIQSLNRKKKKQAGIVENAISSLGRIIQFHSSSIDLPPLLRLWLSSLPVFQDEKESNVVYSQLCQFLILHTDVTLGENYANLPKILSVFGDVVDSKLIDENVAASIKNILTNLQSKLPAEVLTQSFSTLKPKQSEKLRVFMSR